MGSPTSCHSSCLVARYKSCDLGPSSPDGACGAVVDGGAVAEAGVMHFRRRTTCFHRRPLRPPSPSRQRALPASSSLTPFPPRASSAILCAGFGTTPATENGAHASVYSSRFRFWTGRNRRINY